MTITSNLPWKRNELPSPRTPRYLLSSLFIDEIEEYITSDHYGFEIEEGRDEYSTQRCDDDGNRTDSDREPASAESPDSSSSLKSMDFVTFDGVWDDCVGDTSRKMDDDLPWQFIEFGFEKSGKIQKTTNVAKKNKSIQKNKPAEVKSKGKLIRVYDNEKPTSKFPLQNITNNKNHDDVFEVNAKVNSEVKIQEVNYRVQQPRVQQSAKKNFSNLKPLRTKERSIPSIWSKIALSSSSEATSPTASISPLSGDDSFWEEIFSHSPSLCKRMKVAYSKRSTINDGSLTQYVNEEEVKSRDLNPNHVHLQTSYWTEMNKRSYMEDRVLIDFLGNVSSSSVDGLDLALLFQNIKAIKANKQGQALHESLGAKTSSEKKMPLSLYATFDGHAGHLASQYCNDWFSFYLQKQPTYPHDLPLALKSAFHSIDKDFLKSGNEDGTTCCVCAVIGGQKVICANAGDSRAIIVKKNGGVVSLSRDHKPGSPRENKRIKDLGGRVEYYGRWRVEG